MWKNIENATNPGLSIHLCPIAQKDANDVCLICSSCQMEGSFSTNSGDIWICIMLQQVDNNVHAAHEAGHMQWCESRLENIHSVLQNLITTDTQ